MTKDIFKIEMHMKTQALIGLFVFATLNLFAQFNKGDVMISANGNYMKTNLENGVMTNKSATKGQYLDVGVSIGTFITSKFIVGVGLDYNWGKEIRSNLLYINEFNQAESLNLTTNVLMPVIFCGYYQKIVEKLYFSGTFRFSYGKVESEYITLYAGRSIPSGDSSTLQTGNKSYSVSSEGSSKSDYFETKICPELTYFISTRYALCLGLGGIKYDMTHWKVEDSNWMVNFNPNYWKLGIEIKI